MIIDITLCKSSGDGFAPNDGCDYDEDRMFDDYAVEVQSRVEAEYPEAEVKTETESSGLGKIYVFDAENEDEIKENVESILESAYQDIEWNDYVYTYEIWIVEDRGQPDGVNGLRLESPGENDLGHESDSAEREFKKLSRELRELGDDWATADFALTRKRGNGCDIKVIAEDEYEEEEEEATA